MKIEKVGFGFLFLNVNKYGDILIVDGAVRERDRELLKAERVGKHAIAASEREALALEKPAFVAIGGGDRGSLFERFASGI